MGFQFLDFYKEVYSKLDNFAQNSILYVLITYAISESLVKTHQFIY